MALSNIGREPRREITESLVGTLVVFGFLFADYEFGRWVQHYVIVHSGRGPEYWNGFWVAGMFFGAVLILGAYPILFIFPHFIGEVVCDMLAGMGLEPRPKERYR